MEYVILFAVLLAAGALVFAKGLLDEKKERKWRRKRLLENFGKGGRTEYADGELNAVPRYYQKHQEAFSLDDITWNDLDMDRIFLQMNSCGSSAGQEYLYYLLRTPSFSMEELERREALMRFFETETDERLRMQEIFVQMGRSGKYSIYDYLELLDSLGERSNTLTIWVDIALAVSVLLIFFNASAGLMLLTVMLCVNITTYLKEKRRVEPYLVSFQYVFRALRAGKELAALPDEILAQEREMLNGLLPRFSKLQRSAAFGMRRMGDGSPLDVLLDYVNMVFHFDIIGFNVMLHAVRERREDIDALLSVTGRLDALIAAAGYRYGMESRCEPELFAAGENKDFVLAMKQMYHPLLTDAVKNDIEVSRGILLTGSNASGKSTFLKAAAINAVLAQTIHACCADRYAGTFFRVYTSMALRDDLEGGESYYIVEIRALKRILDAADEKGAPVLCFVDEVLRGTNTVERIAASTQILRSLHRPGVCCFAATHDVELTGLLEREYDNYHFEEQFSGGDILFPYQLMPGRASSRNAIRLLEIMGYGDGIIRAAKRQAEYFLESGSWKAEQE